ncbi:MAG: hypothetical protein H7330_05605 [Hymenobacteraceae bacterium]|nr:hypothetical protein [Hymenobacteraceae bacterium]
MPDSLVGDTMATRHFEAGRQAGHTHFRVAKRPVATLPPALPVALAPMEGTLRQRAEAAYALGFKNQIARERADRNDVIGGATGISCGVALIVAAVISTLYVLNSISFPLLGSP